MVAPVIHILPIALIQRERLLPIAGRLLVRKGQRVNPNDPVAEALLAPEHVVIDVARIFGMGATKAERSKAEKLISRRVGEEVDEGDTLAQSSGFMGFTRPSCVAPRNGTIVAIHDGQVFIEAASRPFELKAGLPGDVIDLSPDLGVVIQTSGALIQGVWGNGRIDAGLLNVQLKAPDEILTADRLDVSIRGTIVLGGYCAAEQVLTAAGEIPLKGLILASMPSSLLPVAVRMRYPIIVLEGFGRIPMNSVAFKLLTTNNRRETSLNAETSVDRRPEVIIPLPSPDNVTPLNDINTFSAGQKVRVACAPYLGLVGTLDQILPGLTRMDNGLKVAAAEVQLENGQKTSLPLANLQILE